LLLLRDALKAIVRAKSYCLGIRLMYLSGANCIAMDCCFSELVV
jgi:hypothetical protein